MYHSDGRNQIEVTEDVRNLENNCLEQMEKQGWQKEICLTKRNILLLVREWGLILFPPYSTFLESVEGDTIWLVGFGG